MLSRYRLPLATLLLVVSLVYANSFGNSFHFDDFHTVTDNPAIRSLGNLPRFFTDATSFSVLPANQTYRPVVSASLALDYALGHGYNPFWFHLSSFIWFLVLVALLFFWAEDLYQKTAPSPRNAWLALGLAAWFGLHPAMAETVNYVIQRGDLYCTLGCVAALVLYERFPQQRRWGWYLLPFAVAMLSKPSAVVFPLLLLLYVALFEHGGEGSRRRWALGLRAALPALGLTAALLALEAAMTPKSYAPTILSVAAYRLTQPFVWLRYAGALFLPLHLNVDTDLQPFALGAAAVAGLLFAGALLLAIALCLRHRRLYPIAYGLLWFVLTELPTSLYALSEVENDHRMFFAFPGLMLAVVWALALAYRALMKGLRERAPAWRRALPYAAGGLCGLALCGYAVGAHRRNAVWHDEASLWADDLAKSPHNGRGLMIYGLTRMNAGDLRGALALFDQALLYTPNYPTLEINLGVVNGLLARVGHPALAGVAEQHFLRAVALAPADDLPHTFFGRWLLQQGRLPEAEAQLQTAVQLNGQRLLQRDLLLEAEAAQGQAAQAKLLAASTLRLAPGDAEARRVLDGAGSAGPGQAAAHTASVYVNLSLVLSQAGEYRRSIEAARRAVALDPQSAEGWNNIAAGNEALHRWDEAVAAAQKAIALRPDFQLARNNLAWSLAQQQATRR